MASPIETSPIETSPIETSPAETSLTAELRRRLDEARLAGRVPGLHGVVVFRGGRLALEHYGSGPDFQWGRSLGTVSFGPDTLHDLRSVTKSVVGLLYGIALAAGRVPDPSTSLLSRFPEYPELAADPQRTRLTVAHALTMTLGLEWNEDSPYTSAANSEIAMELAPDRYRYVLERPVVEEPGGHWSYNGGATALVGRLIADGTGSTLPEFARSTLFEPLGINTYEWMAGDDGAASPASGLRLAPRDLARIGQLVLDQGSWHGRQLVPAGWLETALRPQVQIDDGFHYGYQWYLAGTGRRRWVGGMGNGGQRLQVFPELDLVVAVTTGNYDRAEQSATPSTIMDDVVLASID